MASGGWGPVQYLYMAEKALAFRPRVLVVAFYSGNDAFDAVKVAYNLDAKHFGTADRCDCFTFDPLRRHYLIASYTKSKIKDDFTISAVLIAMAAVAHGASHRSAMAGHEVHGWATPPNGSIVTAIHAKPRLLAACRTAAPTTPRIAATTPAVTRIESSVPALLGMVGATTHLMPKAV